MGQFHFDVPKPLQDTFEKTRWTNAYICGIEGIPWQCKNSWQDDRLTITRSIETSGKLHIVCQVGDLGYRSLSTCSLRVNGQPDDRRYDLFTELARGSCFRAQNQADTWERSGLVLGPDFKTMLDAGIQHFLDAIEQRTDQQQSSQSALMAIEKLEKSLDLLGESYTHQSLAFRKKQEPQIGTLLAATLVPPSPADSPAAKTYQEVFNAAAVRVNWADVENHAGHYDFDAAKKSIAWCNERGLRVIAGPLIDFRERAMPHWLYLLEDNFEALLASIITFAERTITELRGTVQLWNCASGLNTPGPVRLDDEQSMRIAVAILQTIRRLDPNTPAIMSFDQPFGEYLSKNHDGISPMHFADALARSGLGLAGLGLDIRSYYQNAATDPRSVVDFGSMIDRWATLGLPLLASVGVPGGQGIDQNAIAPEHHYLNTCDSSEKTDSTELAKKQASIAAPMLRTLLSKHVVHGIVWDGWNDAEPHVSSHSGLLDAGGKARPMLDVMSRLRTDYLS